MPEVAQLDRLNAEAVKGLNLAGLNDELTKRSERMEYLFEKGGESYDLSETEAAEVKALNDELAQLDQAREQKREFQNIRQKAADELGRQRSSARPMTHPAPGTGAGAGQTAPAKTLGELFTEAEDYRTQQGKTSPRGVVEFKDLTMPEVKTVMTLTAGFSQEQRRSGRLVLSAQRRPVVADLIPQDPTTQNAIIYMEETTFTNNAASVAEGGVKPEAALAYTQRSQTVEVIAVTLPVTNQQLDDVPQIRGIIDNRLTLMLELTEETALLNGNGTSPNLLGFYNKSGIQTQAKGADPTPDAIFKAMQKVRGAGGSGFAEPTGIVLHPDDWTDIRLLRTADGIYIWGPPSQEGPEIIWGKPVVQTVAATSGTGLLGDFQLYSHISRRMGLRIEMSTEHSDFFARNQVLLRAEERLSLEIYRAASFATVTGI